MSIWGSRGGWPAGGGEREKKEKEEREVVCTGEEGGEKKKISLIWSIWFDLVWFSQFDLKDSKFDSYSIFGLKTRFKNLEKNYRKLKKIYEVQIYF